MNQLPWRRLKPSLQTAESLSHGLVAQREASTGGLAVQQTGTRANTTGGADPTRGGQHLHVNLIKKKKNRLSGGKGIRLILSRPAALSCKDWRGDAVGWSGPRLHGTERLTNKKQIL